MITENIYDEIYEIMKITKEKGLKMTLKNNLKGVLFTNIYNVESPLSISEINFFIHLMQTHVDTLINIIILKDGNRGKIKLRNFFSKTYKKLWGQYPIS